jgi:hypothetical protein
MIKIMETVENILMVLRHEERMFCDKREKLEMLAILLVPFREILHYLRHIQHFRLLD